MPDYPVAWKPAAPKLPVLRALTVSVATLSALVIGMLTLPLHADQEEIERLTTPKRDGPVKPAEDIDSLRRHFRVRNITRLGDAEVDRIYDRLKAELAGRYAIAGKAKLENYQSWTRYNTVPYLSASHGNRYMNNYANALARNYRLYEDVGILPVGAIVVKDTFTIDENGEAFAGPLMVMEKMPKGFNTASGDWRYVAIMPDGSVLGETGGDAPEGVSFCVPCHLVKEDQDHLHLIPDKYRVKF